MFCDYNNNNNGARSRLTINCVRRDNSYLIQNGVILKTTCYCWPVGHSNAHIVKKCLRLISDFFVGVGVNLQDKSMQLNIMWSLPI